MLVIWTEATGHRRSYSISLKPHMPVSWYCRSSFIALGTGMGFMPFSSAIPVCTCSSAGVKFSSLPNNSARVSCFHQTQSTHSEWGLCLSPSWAHLLFSQETCGSMLAELPLCRQERPRRAAQQAHREQKQRRHRALPADWTPGC